ncbi:MAG TPA: GNAT family N-acetyltransferase [Terracidiphilus sp.]|nr:GNAT family N-acetyltransferase [Terracidiphilus sp.]
MTERSVRPAQPGDEGPVAAMMALLWPDGAVEEFRREAAALAATGMCGTLPAVILVAVADEGNLVGFLQAGLRSHADGCDVDHPVGYVEGWFVQEPARGRGVGRALMQTAEDWARAHGCVEMASDALIDNAASQRAHGALGFEVVDRCVHLRKGL